MKKILIIVGALILIGVGLFFFFGNGKEVVSDFFNEDADFGSFFDIEPQSQNDFVSTPTEDTPPTEAESNSEYVPPTLRQISFEPIAGFTHYATTSISTTTSINEEGAELVATTTATSTVFRFQERASGHIYDVFEFMLAPQKVSNITVQKPYHTIFSNDPNLFIYVMPTLNNEQIKSTRAQIIPEQPETETASSTPQSLNQTDISTAATNFVHIPSNDQIVYSIPKLTGSEVYISDFTRQNERLLITLPFKEFSIEPLSDTHVLIQTHASRDSVGFAYSLRLSNGVLSKILGNIPGLLLKVSSDQNFVLYSESDRSRPIIRTLDRTTGEVRRIGIDTIPEKCIFSTVVVSDIYCFGSPLYKAGTYPDDWYKGKIFNADDLYKIDLTTGTVKTLYVFEDDISDFDVIKPQITQNDGHIAFMSKYDLTLWAIDLTQLVTQF